MAKMDPQYKNIGELYSENLAYWKNLRPLLENTGQINKDLCDRRIARWQGALTEFEAKNTNHR